MKASAIWSNALVLLRSITELSQSGLQQSNGLIVISFKSQLHGSLVSKAYLRRSLRLFRIGTWRLLAGYPEDVSQLPVKSVCPEVGIGLRVRPHNSFGVNS